MRLGLFGTLGIVFIVLKLVKVIDWSWVWVLCPIWGSFAIWLILIVGILLYAKS